MLCLSALTDRARVFPDYVAQWVQVGLAVSAAKQERCSNL